MGSSHNASGGTVARVAVIDSIEEVILLALSTRMPPLIALDRIPQNEWDRTLPFRWRGILLDHPTP